MTHRSPSPFEEQVTRTLERAGLAPPPGLARRIALALGPGPRLIPSAPAGAHWWRRRQQRWPLAAVAVAAAAAVLATTGMLHGVGQTSTDVPSTQLLSA